MRKLIMWNVVTLDGFFEGKNRGIWISTRPSWEKSSKMSVSSS
jgi:hypothetical protein